MYAAEVGLTQTSHVYSKKTQISVVLRANQWDVLRQAGRAMEQEGEITEAGGVRQSTEDGKGHTQRRRRKHSSPVTKCT